MSTRPRIEPDIPDHEVLRKIGGGAYGEVWMARGITGAYRAVKVVWREDFDDERTFEREFEGILKFEPISRDHPGLVNILHVGRCKEGDLFYYYVMELGDDVQSGRTINPVEYEARTLRSDIKAAGGEALPVGPCITDGIRLAEALEHLHDLGLAHRDVKPANIIFVGGKAKLADIGLVADRGQMTFVGTEGFVPPEGPGSAQADVYSLGKVLYEIATGKDRLQFPEVPDELHPDTETKQWQGLNQVICDICEPKVSKRTITSASQLAVALRRLDAGKKLRAGIPKRNLNIALWILLIGFTGYAGYLASPYFRGVKPNVIVTVPVGSGESIDPAGGTSGVVTTVDDPPENKFCIVNFDVEPQDAEVYSLEGALLGDVASFLLGRELEVGVVLNIILRSPGYQDLTVRYEVPETDYDFPLYNLKLDQPPIIGKAWWDSLETRYEPVKYHHQSSWLTLSQWELYTEANLAVVAPEQEVIEHQVKANKKVKLTLISLETATKMAKWLTDTAVADGRLTMDQEIVPVLDLAFKSAQHTKEMKRRRVFPVKLKAQKIPFASMVLESEPKGAKVLLDGEMLGLTDNEFKRIRPGKKMLEVTKAGYKPYKVEIDLKKGEMWQPPLVKLEKNDSLIFGRTWTNKLSMKFVPVNELLMVSAWESRVKDYAKFIKAQGEEMPVPKVNNKPEEPVVHVSYEDAVKFAKWLTVRDQEKGLIGTEHSYRLPTDAEWSLIVGLAENPEVAIPALALQNLDVYPWVGSWRPIGEYSIEPLVTKADPIGNFSDEIRAKFNKLKRHFYKGYFDGNGGTSKVGIYKPNKLGVYDLAGNVSEWVSDTVNDGRSSVVRGSNFKSYANKDLRSSHRGYQRIGAKQDSIGFRLVLDLQAEKPVGDDLELDFESQLNN